MSPVILPEEDWLAIEAGIAQRARLLDRILDDFYGQQTLLASAIVPSRLVFGDSGYLIPLHRVRVHGGVRLHAYAADLVRSSDGAWRVAADWTQAPPGLAPALAHQAIAQPTDSLGAEPVRDHPIHPAVTDLKALLVQGHASGDGEMLAVVLTSEPGSARYSEHALLARLLDCPLVEGGDLTVIDGRVWMKALGGLRRVHAILRQQDDTTCDPLELCSESTQGVAGLVDCCRRGSVLIANALGTGFLESGVLMPFLPDLARRLLAQDLILRSVGRDRQSAQCAGFRFFALATPDGYRVLPGAWALGDSSEPQPPGIRRVGGTCHDRGPATAQAIRSSFVLQPARVAEDLFWLGRYRERCLYSARLLHAALSLNRAPSRALDEQAARSSLFQLARAVQLIGSDESAGFLAWSRAATDADQAFSLMAHLQSLDSLVDRLRERLPFECGRNVRVMRHAAPSPDAASLCVLKAWLQKVAEALPECFPFAPDDADVDVGARLFGLGARIERMAFSSLALQIAARFDDHGGDACLVPVCAPTDDLSRTLSLPRTSGDAWHWLSIDLKNPDSLRMLAEQVQADVAWLDQRLTPQASLCAGPGLKVLERFAVPGPVDDAALMDALGLLRTGLFDLSDRLHAVLFRPVGTHCGRGAAAA